MSSSSANPDFRPSALRTKNTARIIESPDEDQVVRICQALMGGMSGEGKKPSFLKVKAIDGKNNLPDETADGEQIEFTEGLKGPYSAESHLKLQFYRKKGTTEWKVRILARTEDPEKVKEWVKETDAPPSMK